MISEIDLHRESLLRLKRLHRSQRLIRHWLNPIRFYILLMDQMNHEIRVGIKIAGMIRRERELDDRMGQCP